MSSADLLRSLQRAHRATMEDLDATESEVLDIVDDRVPGSSTSAVRYALRLRPRP